MIIYNKTCLIDFLLDKTDYSKSKIKSLLKYRAILVNKKIINKNILLNVGDIVEFTSSKTINNELNILYEDKDIIVVNKKSGLLTIATLKEKEKTLYNMVSEYVKTKNKNNKIFVIHRLDRDTAGIIVFAKNEKIKQKFQNNWDKLVLKRGYIAVCDGIFKEKNGTIKSYLTENKSNYVYITDKNNGKLAITHYRVLKNNEKYSLVDIVIETGRKNQIRVQLKSIGHPILGDLKYGNKSKNKLCLVANELIFVHPTTNKQMSFKLEIPNNFKRLVKD